jgi:hypothetical protein
MVKILATNQQLQVTQENLDGETPFQIAFEISSRGKFLQILETSGACHRLMSHRIN